MHSRRHIQIDDLSALKIPADSQMRPDGAAVLFALREASKVRPGEYERSLWIVPVDGGPARRLTAGPRDSMGRWSPDGSRVAFIRAAPRHRPQLWLLESAGGEARQLTELPEGHIASFKWSPDGSRIALSFRPTPAEFTEHAGRSRREKGESDPPRAIESNFYRLDGDGYFGDARHHLALVEVGTGRHRVLHDGDRMGEFSFDWSPEGDRLAMTTNGSPRAAFEPWMDEILILDAAGRWTLRTSGAPIGAKSAIAWSPDGRSLAWAGREDRRDGLYSPDNLGLWVADAPRPRHRSEAAPARRGTLKLSAVRCLTSAQDFCLMAAILSDSADASFAPTVLWSPDSRRLFTRIGHRGIGHLASIDREGGPLKLHTAGGDRSIGSFSDDGQRLAMVAIHALSPPEVVVARVRRSLRGRTGRPAAPQVSERRLTAFNSSLIDGLLLATPESRLVEAEDGQRSQVWILRPPGIGPRTRTPAVLMVHGGPHAMYGEVFFHEMQLLAGQGYTVLMGNPRGSKGYGAAFCGAIRGCWGGPDWLDVQASLRSLQEDPGVDPTRIAIAGGSYGGYMTNWAIGHTHAFRCAITDRCVSNLLSMAGNSDYPDSGEYWPGKVWRQWEQRWERSPIKHIGSARTPTLIIHSEGDLRCNVEQAEQLFTALGDLGVPAKFIRYPASTSHGMSRTGPPDLRQHRLRAMLDWLNRWMGGAATGDGESSRRSRRARADPR